ncbi:MAG: hypothetical protein ABFD83_02020 [Armatimonadota bacterium]
MRKLTLCCLVIVTAMLLCCGAQAQDQWSIDAGPLQVNIYMSETANLYLVIDQMSLLENASYIDYFEKLPGGLSKEDKELLSQHAAISKEKEWRLHFYYTPLDLESAISKAVKDNVLTEQEAQTERVVFNHFKSRVDGLLAELKPSMVEMAGELESKKQDLTDFATQFSRFTGCDKLTVPVYLAAVKSGEHSHWSNASNGTIAIWAGSLTDLYDSLSWDICGVYLATKRDVLDATVHSVNGLDSWVLSQAISYAYSPSMLGDDGLARLERIASQNVKRGANLSESYTAATLLGLALQPILKQALDDQNQTLETFLPKAADTWRSLQALSKAMNANQNGHDYRTDPRHSILSFGNVGWDAVQTLAKNYGYNLFGRDNSLGSYKELFGKIAKPGDTVILLLSLDDPQRVPDEYSDLMPIPWPDIETKLKQGQTVLKWGKARDMNVLLIAAPTKMDARSELQKLAEKPDALKNP